MKKTIYLSQAIEINNHPSGYKFSCPYLFYDKHYRKWYEDTIYFMDEKSFKEIAKHTGFQIK